MNLRKTLVAVLIAQSVIVPVTASAQMNPIAASVGGSLALSSAVVGSVVVASSLALHAGSRMVVQSLQFAGDVVRITLAGVAAAGIVVIEASAATIRTAGLAVGQAVEVIAREAGYAVMSGVELLAFVPAATTVALLHSSRSQ